MEKNRSARYTPERIFMIPVETIIAEVKSFRPNAKVEIIKKAYDVSKNAHEGQKRKSGDPYFEHPVEVAYILAKHRMDEDTVATGLLHDVVEDTLISVETIQKDFGPQIAQMVDGVTKLSKISFRSKDVRQNESFRKMLLAMAKDIRVIIVKLADRLHNMRTLVHMPEMKQVSIAHETLDIYAPLANRLGISWMKLELEDLSFRFTRPSSYEKLEQVITTTEKERNHFIARVIEALTQKMREEKIRCDISGRHKHLYSIFRKMESRNLDFDQINQINDILAFRIIVDSLSHCYEALGHVHSMWKPVPGRFKDFIALPKANMYQSLHTTVIGPSGERIEIQIRTRQMHRIAEDGIAAHWSYKSEETTKTKDIEQFGWLRQMLEIQQELKDPHEFMETVKIDLFADEVYVFTPKGDVLEFPRGSTPIDFAFRVHSQVGYRCKGAKVNGKMVPLRYKLQNGDTVEIITSEQSHPTKDWLKFAVTSRAKSKIKAVLRTEQRDAGTTVGREVLIKELRRYGENYEKLLASGKLKEVSIELGYKTHEDLLLALGYGKIASHEVIHLLLPEVKTKELAKKHSSAEIIHSHSLNKQSSPIQVGGLDDIMIRYGKCCDPLPGDPIVGFITRGRGVTIHKSDCYKIFETDAERKVDVSWAKDGKGIRTVRIRVIAKDSPGILADISRMITKNGGNISHASVKTTEDQKAINMFEVGVSNASQLHFLIRSIEKITGVISVERLKS